jgi:hypothetical protein
MFPGQQYENVDESYASRNERTKEPGPSYLISVPRSAADIDKLFDAQRHQTRFHHGHRREQNAARTMARSSAPDRSQTNRTQSSMLPNFLA